MRTLQALYILAPPFVRRFLKMDRQRSSTPESEDAAPAKSKSKLGVFKSSFRTVGRGKNPEGDAAPKDKKKLKKAKDKSKVKDKPKTEASSEDAEGSVTEGSESPPVKVSKASKATTLVRKLSIGKYKVGASGASSKTQPPSKTPTPPPPEESPTASKSDVSSETGGRQAPEGEDGRSSAAEETPPPPAHVAQSQSDGAQSQSAGETSLLVTQQARGADDAIPEETPDQVALPPEDEEPQTVEPQTVLEQEAVVEELVITLEEVKTEEREELPPPVTVVEQEIEEVEEEKEIEKTVEVERTLEVEVTIVNPEEVAPMSDLVEEEVPQDIVLAPALPSLKSEIQTAERLIEAERAENDASSATAGGRPIGDAIAEARTRLSHSLETAASVAQQVPEKREHLYKILVIGELGTGKTSIIKRYVHQFFSQHYRATIGVDFALKVLNWDANTIIRLQLWDIAGQERFGNMTRVYYKEAVGAFIVFDVTRAATFDAVLKWKQDLDSKVTLPDGSPIPCVLLANKCDQQKEGIVNNSGKMDEYCKEKGFSAWFETSAKENINIEEAARSLVKKILQNDKLINQNDSSKDAEKIALDGKASDGKTGGRCSC